MQRALGQEAGGLGDKTGPAFASLHDLNQVISL